MLEKLETVDSPQKFPGSYRKIVYKNQFSTYRTQLYQTFLRDLI